MVAVIFLFIFCCVFRLSNGEWSSDTYETNCSNLLLGQYMCSAPDIDESTQQPKDCSKENKATSKPFTIDLDVC